MIDSGLSNKAETSLEQQTMQDTPLSADAVVSSADEDVKLIKADDSGRPSTCGTNDERNTHDILLSIPEEELRLLCSLLALEGYDSLLVHLPSLHDLGLVPTSIIENEIVRTRLFVKAAFSS